MQIRFNGGLGNNVFILYFVWVTTSSVQNLFLVMRTVITCGGTQGPDGSSEWNLAHSAGKQSRAHPDVLSLQIPSPPWFCLNKYFLFVDKYIRSLWNLECYVL